MKRDPELNARSLGVLEAVVKSYIATGQPVASRTIARAFPERLSSASIRNVMQDLADAGYLSQPHTSAGRVPTQKAFRCFVQYLKTRALPADDVEKMRARLVQLDTMEERVEFCSRTLTDITHAVGIMAALPGDSPALDQVELVPLPDLRILICMVMRDGAVHNRVVNVDEPIPAAELASIRNYINTNFSGWTLADARNELDRRLREERSRYDQILSRMIVLYTKGLLEEERAPEMHMEGMANLLGWHWNLTQERLRDLFRALEQKQRILELLDRFVEERSGELSIQVGLEEAHPTMHDLALIGTAVHLSNGMTARIAVLGPIRMHYPRIISAVLRMGQAFETLPS